MFERRTWAGDAMRVVLVGCAALAAAPLAGSDHLDDVAFSHLDADLCDLFVFVGANPANRVLALTTSPVAGAIGPRTFGTETLYELKIDTDGDADADVAYRATFGVPDGSGRQPFTVRRASGLAAEAHEASGTVVATGRTPEIVSVIGGGQAFAGLLPDPAFFDLGGFQGTLGEQNNGRTFNDGNQSDFFDDHNVLAFVLEVPVTVLADAMGVWGASSLEDPPGTWTQVDRVGRPLVNLAMHSTGTVVGAPSVAKDNFNEAEPENDATFEQAFESALIALSAFDTSEGAYSLAEADAVADALLPDLLRFEGLSVHPPPFGRRAPADDVVDAMLNLFTGGNVLGLTPGRTSSGGFPTDSIGPHADYSAVFPYLSAPPACTASHGASLVLHDDTVSSVKTYEVCGVISVGPAYAVMGPAGNLTLRAGDRVELGDGFSTGVDAVLAIEIDATLVAPW